jgi:hypothetical protein
VITRRTALARARRGAALLDTKYKTWRQNVNVYRLDQSSGFFDATDLLTCGCVLSQIDAWFAGSGFGRYSHRAHKLFGINWLEDPPVKYGFVVRGDSEEEEEEYKTLTEAWKTVLAHA